MIGDLQPAFTIIGEIWPYIFIIICFIIGIKLSLKILRKEKEE
jgi:hypothetical protein